MNAASYQNDRAGEAKDAFETLRGAAFIEDHGKRGIALSNSHFDDLAVFLHEECDWDEATIKIKIKHFEGWEDIGFHPGSG